MLSFCKVLFSKPLFYKNLDRESRTLSFFIIFTFLILSLTPLNSLYSQTPQFNPDSIPFAPAVNYGAGDGPNSVFCSDLDGDFDLDLAVANAYSNSVSILKNNGDGTYQTKVDYGTGNYTFSVFCADLDGDGDLDLAVANCNSDNVSVLKNNGDGTFQAKVDYGAGDCPHSVFCADLDGDGDLDLAVANAGSNNVSILKNNGDGTYQTAVNYGAGDYPVSVFCADLDGDTDLDLAVANNGSNNISILKNNGNGTFQTKVDYGAGDGTRSVFCADLDGDTDLDLAVANAASNTISIFKNNGDGTFLTKVDYGTIEAPVSVFCADLDGDTDLDLAVAKLLSDSVSILLNMTICNDPDSDGVCNEGLVAYYPFNGNANDESGNGHDGTVVGATLSTDRCGNPNHAFSFDGQSDEIQVPHSDALNITGDITLSAWFNSVEEPLFRTDHTILTKRTPNPIPGNFPYLIAINYVYGIPSDYKKPIFISAANSSYQYLQSTSDITINTWNHMAAVVSSNNLRIFINGVVVLDTVINNQLRTGNTAPLLIGSGARTDPPAEQFKGQIDDVRIYNRALSFSEIQALYHWPNCAPNSYSLISPPDIDSVKAPITFNWQTALVPDPNDTVRYDLYLSRSMVFAPESTIVYDSLLDTTFMDSVDFADTSDIRLWSWKVKAYDKWGAERWSDQSWSFYVYLCGDCNGDGKINVADVVFEINYLFKGGPVMKPLIAGEVNCDGNVTVSDVVYTINYLFKGGDKPCKNCP